MDGTTTNDDELRKRATERVQNKRAFTTHAASYVLVNALFWVIWAFNDASASTGIPWPAYVMFFWGIGLAFHAWNTFGRREVTDADIDREMERMRSTS